MAITAIAGLASAGGAYVAAIAAGTAFGLTAFATAFAIGAGLSMVSRALAPKPNLGAQMRGVTQTSREPAGSRKIVYGKMRVGGQVVFISNSGDDNKYLHMAIAFASHEVESYEEIWFNDKKVWTLSGGFQGDWGTYVTIDRKFGTDGQAASTDLVNANVLWTTNHKLSGIAYIAFRLEWDTDKFPQGVPNITAVLKGKKVYDPRSSSTVWSQNPALCLRDYMLDDKYGLGEVASNIDSTSLTAAANLCEEQITLDAGGTQDRYQCNGVIETGNQIRANIDQLLASMGGMLTYSGGKYFIDGAEYKAPALTFTESDVISDIQTQTKQSRRGIYNGVKGIFVSEEKNYKVLDYPPQISSTYATEDGDPIYLDMALPFVTNNTQAQRLAKIALLKSRQQVVINMTVNLKGLQVKVGDTINVTNDRLNYSSKVFQVIDYSMAIGDGGALAVHLACIETASAIYDWTTSDEGDFLSGGELNLYDGRTVANVTSLVLTEVGFKGPDGNLISAIDLAWTGPNDAFVELYKVRYNKTGTTNYFYASSREPRVYISGLDITSNYDFRVQAENLIGVSSTGTTLSDQALNGDTTAPSVPTSASATGGIQTITAEWTNPSDVDFKHTEVFVSTSNSIPATPTAVVDGEEYIVTGLSGAATRYFWLKSVDFSGNKSAATASFSAASVVASSSDIGTGAVGSGQIATGAVNTDQIANDAVDITKIANTLESTNYVLGSAGWKLTTDGTFEAGDGTFRGALTATSLDVQNATVTGTLSANNIAIDGVTLDTNSSGEIIIKDGGVTNDQIGASAVAASNIIAGSVSKLNPVTQTQNVYRWGGYDDAGNVINAVPSGIAVSYDTTEKALELRNDGDVGMRSDTFVVDQNSIYKITAQFKKDTALGNYYVGAYQKASFGRGQTQDGGNTQGQVAFTYYNPAREASSATNAYFFSASATTSYVEKTAYLIGSNVNIDEVPETDFGIIQAADGYDNVAIRILNWSNGGTTTSLFVKHFSIVEMTATTIIAENISTTNLAAINSNLGAIDAGSIDIGGGNFTVSTAGAMTATGATISGGITATSLSLDSSVNIASGNLDTTVVSGAASGATALQNGDDITDGTVGGITITSNSLYQGTGTWANSNTGFYLDNTGKFSLKDKLFFNPSNTKLTVAGNIEADAITVNDSLVVLGPLEAKSLAAGSITREMFSQDALDEIFGSLATSVGGSNGDYKENSGSFTASGGTVTLGTSSDKFDHGTSNVDVEFLVDHFFYVTTNYTTAQAQATLNFEVSADGTFTDLTSATKTHTLQFFEYDLSSYYGYTYLVYYLTGDVTKTFTTSEIADNTDLQFRVRVTGVGTAFTGQTVPFTLEANEGVTGVVSTGGNADTLDNLDSTAFLRSNTNDTFDGDLTITGQLILNGSIDQYNVTDLDVADKTITVNSGNTQTLSDGAGLIVDRGTADDASILWNETTDQFDLSHGITISRPSPWLTLKDTTDNDDHKIVFTNATDGVEYEISTQNATSNDSLTFYSLSQEIVSRIGTANIFEAHSTVVKSLKPLEVTGTVTATGATLTAGRLTLADGGYSIGNELHVWKRAYAVSSSSPQDLLYHDGTALPNGGAYRMQAHIPGTGTDQSATAVFWNQDGTWKVNATYQSGTSSNHPEFKVGSNGKPQIHIDHTSSYGIAVLHERLELSEGSGTDNKSGFGADGYLSEVEGVLRHNPNGGSDYTAGNRIWNSGDFANNATSWNTAYTYSQVGHLPLSGGTLTGNIVTSGNVQAGSGSGGGFSVGTDSIIGSNKRLTAADGTTSKAAYGFLSSSNTGLSYTSGHRLNFLANGAVKAYIQSGSSNPITPVLYVDGRTEINGAVIWAGGTSANANTAYGWGDHASAGYSDEYKNYSVASGADHDTHHWNKTHAAYSNSGSSPTYIVLTTNVPQDSYSMGGFTLIFQNHYSNNDEGDVVNVYGYWNAESNSGFVGFRYHATNPDCNPTIEVGRNSSGKTVFIISNESGAYAQVIAKDLWLGYSASSANSSWGDSWAFSEASTLSAYTNRNTLNRTGLTAAQVTNWDTAYTYSQVGHLPLIGGTLTGSLSITATNNTEIDITGDSAGNIRANADLYLLSQTGSINLGAGGTNSKLVINSSGNATFAGTLTGSGKLQINQAGTGTSNNNVSPVAVFSGQSQGGTVNALSLVNSVTGANNNGVSIGFHNGNAWSPTGTITTRQEATGTTTDSRMVFQTYRGGLHDALVLDHDQNAIVFGHMYAEGGNITAGTATTDSSVKVFHSDGDYSIQKGWGMEFARTASYLRPNTDNDRTMYFGASTLRWDQIQLHTTSLKMGAVEFLDASRNASFNTISSGAISSGAITSTGTSSFNNFRLSDSSRMGFGTVKAGATVGHSTTVDEGIFWHTGNNYGIYRTAGTWASPNYPYLRIQFDTGIKLDGGVAGTHGNSGVDIVGSSDLQMAGTTVIDASRNISAGNITASGSVTANNRVFVNADHGTTKFQLAYEYSGQNHANNADVLIWASEPGVSYNGGGFGVNIHENGQYYGRADDNKNYGVYMRMTPSNGYTEFWNTTGARGTNAGQGTKRVSIEASGRLVTHTGGVASVGQITTSVSNLDPSFYASASDAYIRVGGGSGAAGVFGAHREGVSSSSLDYTTYIGYDCYFDDGDNKWYATRTSLGRKWKTNFGGYHQNRFTISTYDGGGTSGSSIADGWLEADWTERFGVSSTGVVDIGSSLRIGTDTVIDSSRNITASAITASSIVSSDNVAFGNSGNISMDSSANGQVEIKGSGYQGAIALNASGMHIYHNSSARSLVLGTNETARMTISGSGTFDFHARSLTNIGAITTQGPLLLTVSDTDSAHQRVDVRDETNGHSRAHWYSVSDNGTTSNFRHAWYDGSTYINVTAESSTVTFGGNIGVSGNGSQLKFTGGNNRILFSAHRALEGDTTGAILTLAEGYGSTTVRSHLNMQSGYEIRYAGTTVIDANRNISCGTITSGAITSTGNVTTSSTLVGANVSAGGVYNYDSSGHLRLLHPAGAAFKTGQSTVTGAIKIVLPVSWTSTMMRMTIKVYEYAMGESFTIDCGGYNYISNGSWINTFAYITGQGGTDRNFAVRFGHDGSKCCIYIGELNSTWSYPQLSVTDFQAGFNSTTSGTWRSGWDITFESSAFGTVTKHHTETDNGRYHGNLSLRNNTNGDGAIIRDIEFLTTAAPSSDDRSVIIRALNESGGTSTRGGKLEFLTRKTDGYFNTTTIDSTGALTVQGLSTLESGLQTNNSQLRVKISPWVGTTYGIGMKSGMTFGGLNNYAMTFQMDSPANRGWWWGTSSHTDAQGAMALTNAGKLSVASNTRIGMGYTDTVAPSGAMLEVGGGVVVHAGTVWSETTQGGGKGSIHLDPALNTTHAGGAITWGASDTSNGTTAQAGIYVRSDSGYGTRMYLSTTDSYASGSKTALYIDTVGNVSITRGSLVATGNVTAYSDIKLKRDILEIPDALAIVQKIRGVTYERKDKDDGLRHCGVIAQEVEAAGLPEVVRYDEENDVKTVDYGNMVALCIQAIKEQQDQIDTLKTIIEEMKNGNN